MFFQKIKTLRTLYYNRTGQILGNDTLAMWLRAITTDPDVLQIVEIGAWEGKGSTRVFAEAAERVAETKSISIISLEASRERALRAQKRNKKFRCLQIIWGSIIAEQDLDNRELSESENIWITEDINTLKSCPQVLDLIPDSIDALFLDGGEFSTKKEYDLLFERVAKWLILDDTCSRKSASIAKEIRSGNTPFTVVVDSQQRNGFMVAFVETKRSDVSPGTL